MLGRLTSGIFGRAAFHFHKHELPGFQLRIQYSIKTSRQIEKQMLNQYHDSLQNAFKAIKTSFGLKCPTKVQGKYEKPSTIFYSEKDLRECSHKYPQYLFEQLKDEGSEFYFTIDKMTIGLEKADKTASIQFIEFLIHWGVYEKKDYAVVISRKVEQLELNIAQCFRLLKSVMLMKESYRLDLIVHVENMVLTALQNINQSDYDSLFKIVNFLRVYDIEISVKKRTANINQQQQIFSQQTESFFTAVKSIVIQNIKELPLKIIAEMLVHYANNIKESFDDRMEILKAAETKVINNLKFFTNNQLIAVMHAYIKTQSASPALLNEFVLRMNLLFNEFSWEIKVQILQLSAATSPQRRLQILSLFHHELLRGKKIFRKGKEEMDLTSNTEMDFQLLPAVYLASFETNTLTEEITVKVQKRILDQFFNYSSSDVALITWLFTVSTLSQKHCTFLSLLHSKIEVLIEGGFLQGSFTVKDVSTIVWSMCSTEHIYKESGKFWNNIQLYIQDKIKEEKPQLLKDCCYVLWAYVNNRPLTFSTINIITNIILNCEKEALLEEHFSSFELSSIMGFYYSLDEETFPSSLILHIKEICLKQYQRLLLSLNAMEIMKCLKFFSFKVNKRQLSTDLWILSIEALQNQIKTIEYTYIMGVVGLILSSPPGQSHHPKAVALVTSLLTRKKLLQQIKVQQARHISEQD